MFCWLIENDELRLFLWNCRLMVQRFSFFNLFQMLIILCEKLLTKIVIYCFVHVQSTATEFEANDWTVALNNKTGIFIAYIDFANAFIVVQHRRCWSLPAGCPLTGSNWTRTRLELLWTGSIHSVCLIKIESVQRSGSHAATKLL